MYEELSRDYAQWTLEEILAGDVPFGVSLGRAPGAPKGDPTTLTRGQGKSTPSAPVGSARSASEATTAVILYPDSSAAVKLYVAEEHDGFVHDLARRWVGRRSVLWPWPPSATSR